MDAETHVESVFAHELDHVLVGANASSFQGLGGELFILVRDYVDAERKLVDTRLLQNLDLGYGLFLQYR